MDLIEAPIDESVPGPIVPVNDLARAGAECEPVPGLRGHLLTEHDQEVIGSQRRPHTGCCSRVVLGRRDEVEPDSACPVCQLLGSEFSVRVDGVDMAVPAIPARPASHRPYRWEVRARQGSPPSTVCRANVQAEHTVPCHRRAPPVETSSSRSETTPISGSGCMGEKPDRNRVSSGPTWPACRRCARKQCRGFGLRRGSGTREEGEPVVWMGRPLAVVWLHGRGAVAVQRTPAAFMSFSAPVSRVAQVSGETRAGG